MLVLDDVANWAVSFTTGVAAVVSTAVVDAPPCIHASTAVADVYAVNLPVVMYVPLPPVVRTVASPSNSQ
jgi:hypothetical protein